MTESAAFAAAAAEDQPIRRIHRDGTEFVLLGTAHVSRRSAEAVREIIEAESFDAIAIELCEHRARSIEDPDAVAQMDLFRVLREGKAGVVMAGLALGAFQRRLAEQFGIEPGAEMRTAMLEAKTRGLDCWLIDRDVGLTLRRARAALGFWDKTTLTAGMIGSVLSSDDISEEEIEKLKQGDVLQSTFSEFAKQSEHLYRALIAERDQFMAAKLRAGADRPDKPAKVLAVLGAGHLEGIANHLSEGREAPNEMLAPVSAEPPPSRFGTWFGIGLTLLVVALFAIAFSKSMDLGWQLVETWALVTVTGGLIGGIAAMAHPLAILAGALTSPVTTLHPALSSGMFSGAIQAWLRRPKVGDFSALRDDLMHWKGWWRNRVAHVFVTFMLTNLGTAIGFYVAVSKMGAIVAKH
ncbi:MAG: TraB/GumN family protein [Xanthomonadales bacterium]|nr:TraB/GumN family protein [Xanthomonadales bacterium]MBK7144740.1 TraB/GumN family protein [Xanthomonadales bacterium]